MTTSHTKKRRLVWLHPKIEKPMGGTNFVLYVAEKLARSRKVLVIAQRTSPAMEREFSRRSIELRSLDCPTYTELRFWLFYRYWITLAARRIGGWLATDDIVVSSMFPMNVVAAKLGRNDIQILYEPFSFFFDDAFLRGFGPAVAGFFRVMRWLHAGDDLRTTGAARQCLALSRFEADRIRSVYGVESGVIYEGVDTATFNTDVAPYPEFRGRTVILHSTGFDRFKGTDLVIAAMPDVVRHRPDVLLVVTYTREDRSALRRYQRQMSEANMEDQVRFLGTVAADDLPSLYRAARLYVEPGRDRSMSLSVKEAMACGTPVVRGAEGWEEVDDGVEGFLVQADDREGYIRRVNQLLNDDALRAKMSAAAVRRIREKFTWTEVAQRIEHYAGAVTGS